MNNADPHLSLAETFRRNPFRLFFPMGMMAGILGVGHWAMWTMGFPVPDIKNVHIMFQSQGFLALFVVGFLFTAFPRFSGTNPATLAEMGLALTGAALFFIGALAREWRFANVGTLIMVATLPVFASRRFSRRTKPLPPSFLLLGFGLLQALAGVLLSLVTNMGESNSYLYAVGRHMVQVGFLLCMVLGITAKLARFLMGYTDDPGCEEDKASVCLSGRTEVAVHGLAGLLIVLGCILTPFYPRTALGLLAAVSTVHLILFAKISRPLRKKTATVFFFWLSCWMIPAGFWLGFVLPRYRVAALHVVFIGGFSLMIFSFGLLVVLSHSGRAALLNGKLWALKSIGIMTLAALGFRLAADFLPDRYMFFLHNGSGFWVVAAAVWLLYALPKMRGIHHEH